MAPRGKPPASFTDAELLTRRLFVANPMEEPGLTMTLEPGVRMEGILAAYDHRAFRLACAECGAARHFKGYLVELSNGARTLLGNHCGAKVFGEDWVRHHSHFRRIYDRQALLKRCLALRERLPKLIEATASLIALTSLSAERMRDFERDFPATAQALRFEADRADGWLEADFEVPNPDDPEGPPRAERRRLGRLAGLAAFELRALHRGLEDVQKAFRDALAEFWRNDLPDRVLDRAVKACGDGEYHLVRAVEAHNAALEFLSPANLKLIAAWASRKPHLAGECPDGRGLRRFKVVTEEVVTIKEKRTVTMKDLTGAAKSKAERLLMAARKMGGIEKIRRKYPHYFERTVIKQRHIDTRNVRREVHAPTSEGLEPVSLAEIERLTGELSKRPATEAAAKAAAAPRRDGITEKAPARPQPTEEIRPAAPKPVQARGGTGETRKAPPAAAPAPVVPRARPLRPIQQPQTVMQLPRPRPGAAADTSDHAEQAAELQSLLSGPRR